MKRSFLLIALSFGTLLGASATAYAQSDTTCTEIHYTDEMDKAAQECWENAQERENMLAECLTTWSELKNEIGTYKLRVEVLRDIASDLSLDNEKLKKKVKRNRIGTIVSSSIGGLAIILGIAIK